MDNKPIIKPEWIPAAYTGVDDMVKVKVVKNVGGVPFYKRGKGKDKKKR